jgi:tRNA-binding EMAP/Myf-like protein
LRCYKRFTQHPIDELKNRLVLGVLNFEPRQMGPVISEVLILGVQYPKTESGEAIFVSPAVNAKILKQTFLDCLHYRQCSRTNSSNKVITSQVLHVLNQMVIMAPDRNRRL